MSKAKENVAKEEKIKAVVKVTTAINMIHEPLKKFILDKQTKPEEIKKIKKFDFSYCLKYIKDNLNEIFANHVNYFDESKKRELKKMVVRCIEIRNKAAHQNYQGSMRDIESLCRLAALLGSEVESSVKSVLNEEENSISSGEADKDSWIKLKEIGNRYVKEGRFTEAIIEYTKAIRIDQNQPVLYSNRAIAELRLKMYKEAREDAEDAIDKSNSSSSADSRVKYYRLLSEALIGLGLLYEARFVCEKGLELDSRDDVLLLRNRDIYSKIITQKTDENPRESLFKEVENNLMPTLLNFMERFRKLDPSSDDIHELDMKEHHDILIHTTRLAEAHNWFHGLNGKPVKYQRAFEIFEAEANKGNAEGLYNIGMCYGKGLGVPATDYIKMLDCFRKAASQKPFYRINRKLLFPNIGVADAENGLGNAYRDGNGVDIDYTKAFNHYLRAAQLDQSEAQNNLGLLLQYGNGVAKNEKFAREWFKKAAVNGIAEAQFNYAEMCELGQGGEVDEKSALDFYQKSSLQGMPNALSAFQRLTRTINEKETNKRFEETLKTAEKNKDPNALFLLGQNYLKDDNIKELELAYKNLKEASDLNHLEATYLLSDLLLNKLKRSKEGFEYCLKASERGHVIASRYLINLYAYGHGCERDEEKARRIANRVSLIYNSMLNNTNESIQVVIKDELVFNMDKDIVQNIDLTIKTGRELCEFEEKENLSKDGLNYKDRLNRFFDYKCDKECQNRNQKSDPIMEKFKSILLNENPNPKPVDQVRYSLFDWMPQVFILAQKGSITATRMIDGVNKGFEAIDCISKNEYEKGVKLIKQSYIECDKDIFTLNFTTEITEAIEKCNQKDPDVMFVKALLFHNNYRDCIPFVKRCLKTHPNDAHLYQHLACLYGFAGDFDDSFKSMDKALKLDNSNPRWFYLKATSMRLKLKLEDMLPGKADKAKIDECLEWYQKYLESNPSDDRKVPESYFSMGFLNALKEDRENTKLYWFKALEAEKVRLPCFEHVSDDSFPPKPFTEIYLMSFAEKCGQCMKLFPKFKCPCFIEAYCDRNCQKAHWITHKNVCKIRAIQN